jgi:large subunit ribosomal protein L21
MYAVIRCGGKQYRVEKGDEIVVDRMPGEPGEKVELKDIVLIRGEKVLFGPEARKAKIKASIVEQFLGEKIVVFKYKPKKNYRRKKGFRAHLTRLKIEEIKLPSARRVVKKEEKQTEKEAKEKVKERVEVKREAKAKVGAKKKATSRSKSKTTEGGRETK